jgi:hypothetical protein
LQQWQQAVCWQGRQNRYQAGTGWLAVNGRVVELHGLPGWREQMRSQETGSLEEATSYPRQSTDPLSAD